MERLGRRREARRGGRHPALSCRVRAVPLASSGSSRSRQSQSADVLMDPARTCRGPSRDGRAAARARRARPPTWSAARSATCCSARAPWISTWPWRATLPRWPRRSRSGSAGRPWCTTASARPPCARASSRSTWPRTRRETYERPGALPTVEPAGLDEDLRPARLHRERDGDRPDGRRRGRAARPARRRGRPGDRARSACCTTRSFLDDPTRLLRAVRYEARLGFAMDPETERLAREAAEAGALDTVSGAARARRAAGPARPSPRRRRRSSGWASWASPRRWIRPCAPTASWWRPRSWAARRRAPTRR